MQGGRFKKKRWIGGKGMPQAEIHFQMTGWGKDLIAPFGVGVAPEKKGKNPISRQKTLDVYKSESK